MRRAAMVLAALLCAAPACGGGDGPRARAPKREARPAWQDVFETLPDIFLAIRPQAIRRDPVYGALYKALLRIAQAKRIVTGPSSLEAAEGSEEILLGLNPGLDAAIVFRGVPASLDPNKVIDDKGEPLFRLVDDHGSVPEYELTDRRGGEEGSVFILPDRTWVGAFGDARERARAAFATPFGRPAPRMDPAALAVARFGQGFVQRPRYVKSPVWGLLTKRLDHVTIALRPDKGGIVATLAYADGDAAAFAELQAKQMLEALGGEPRFAWLEDATVTSRPGARAVEVRMAVPKRLLEELPKATGGDIPFDAPGEAQAPQQEPEQEPGRL